MSPTLREQRKVRTSATIAAAALELFTARGYAAVTVGEVAAAAGVAERTLYRYFADKDDLLFADDEQLRAELRRAIEQQPDGSPVEVLRGASATVARALQGRREEVARRAAVVAASPALTAREGAKRAAWEAVLAEGLSRRGVAPADAALLGRIAVACHSEAMARWLAPDDPSRALDVELDGAFSRLAALMGGTEVDPTTGRRTDERPRQDDVRVTAVIADLAVADIEAAKGFYTGFLGLSTEDFSLGWVARYSSPWTGAHLQLVTRDATAPEVPVISVLTDDVDAAYAEAQELGYEIVHPLTDEPWGVRRFFVRAPDGTVVNVVRHRD